MTVKKIIGWAVVLFITWFIFTNPQGAAGVFDAIKGAFSTAASSLATFAQSATGG
jgi:hypothetical protein